MLSKLKKNPDAEAKARAAGWHPNFRDFGQLPDTKVVRTSFFINAIAALVVIVALTFVAYQEYTLSILKKQVDDWSAKIDQAKKPSGEAVAMYKAFQEQEKIFVEAEEFAKGQKISISEFMVHLAEVMPKNIALTSIEFTPATATLRGAVRGDSEIASGVASAFEKQLREDAIISKAYPSIALTTLARDAQGGKLTFEIAARSNDQGGKKK
jgi:hypothetical protein